MEESDTSVSLSSLLCQEDEDCFNEKLGEHEEHKYTNLDPFFVLENEDEYIEKLVQRETCLGLEGYVNFDGCSTIGQSWLKCARLDAIQWILNTRAFFGFHFRTAYLSVTYFDRFLSRRFIDNGKFWAIQLLAVACLSLAAKMEECKVPGLSEYPIEDYQFENNVIQRMELLVLSTLKWKMVSITPFTYIHYFINKFCGKSKSKELVSTAVELVLGTTKDINSMGHRPSIIAAAAVLTASDGQLSRETVENKLNVISSWGSLENEHLFSCYNLMQEIEMRKCKTPKMVISSNLSSFHSSSTDVLETTSLTSAVGTKRRLTFNDSDQNCPLKKIHPQ
ncbi:hypothetical protein L1049_024511 [Liquidambar formosana]|uniref:B-like cyclin n=1 Tax=Liquidambar formosana TaxID=63359 RepID=A0AAP0S237_LIQFO